MEFRVFAPFVLGGAVRINCLSKPAAVSGATAFTHLGGRVDEHQSRAVAAYGVDEVRQNLTIYFVFSSKRVTDSFVRRQRERGGARLVTSVPVRGVRKCRNANFKKANTFVVVERTTTQIQNQYFLFPQSYLCPPRNDDVIVSLRIRILCLQGM